MKKQEIEIWKDIAGYIGKYQVSNLGNIKSFLSGSEKILKPSINKNGYLNVSLCFNGKKHTFPVHKLVALSFLSQDYLKQKLVVNHKNFIRTDNRVKNLEITTTRQNANQKHLLSSSKYTGVFWNIKKNKWTAGIVFNKKIKYLGVFSDELEASKYYQKAILSIQNNKKIDVKKPKFSSKYKGVSFHKSTKKWMAYLWINKKRKYLGLFETEIQAHKEYKKQLKNISCTQFKQK